MTDKKTTKTEKQAEKKPPTELKDDEIEKVHGGRLDPGAFEPPTGY